MYICILACTYASTYLSDMCYFYSGFTISKLGVWQDTRVTSHKKYWKAFAASEIPPIVSSIGLSLLLWSYWIGDLGTHHWLSLFSDFLIHWQNSSIFLLLLLTTIAITNSFKCYISFYSLIFPFSKEKKSKEEEDRINKLKGDKNYFLVITFFVITFL